MFHGIIKLKPQVGLLLKSRIKSPSTLSTMQMLTTVLLPLTDARTLPNTETITSFLKKIKIKFINIFLYYLTYMCISKAYFLTGVESQIAQSLLHLNTLVLTCRVKLSPIC
ncbi:unnamed protein product [Pipistrellus nathusii]|uniref:Uncharacterized protein n=1 Tax=Pipistrellus nathusii TaxID=59473 RepID=A0ABP0AMJ2_PIPNA